MHLLPQANIKSHLVWPKLESCFNSVFRFTQEYNKNVNKISTNTYYFLIVFYYCNRTQCTGKITIYFFRAHSYHAAKTSSPLKDPKNAERVLTTLLLTRE